MLEAGWGISVIMDSVVSTMAATDAAFCNAERVTFTGSMMPRSSMGRIRPARRRSRSRRTDASPGRAPLLPRNRHSPR